MYKSIIRPLLFLSDPEKIHRRLFSCLRLYKHIPFMRTWARRRYTYEAPYRWNDLVSINRVGLSAGFDKAGEAFDELADFGFGFIELGTVTPSPQEGNPAPRVFRLPKRYSLVSRTGFNNPGMEKFKENLSGLKKRNCLVGININKDERSEGQKAIDDFSASFLALYDEADYFTLNWGSVDAGLFAQVLEVLTRRRKDFSEKRPIFIKLPADISEETMIKVIGIASRHGAEGFIATGPTADRSNLHPYTTKELDAIGAGNISGKGIGNKSLNAVKFLREHSGKNMLIIGAGGIMSPHDARKMTDAGADLVQIYSAFIYSGPLIVKKMAKEIKG